MSGNYRGRRTALLRWGAAAVLAAAAVLGILYIYVYRPEPQEPGQVQKVQRGGTEQTVEENGEPDPVQTPDAGPDTSSDRVSDAVPEPSPEDPVQSGEEAGYDFSQPAPARAAVGNDYFADAAFVGDSRTDGFMLYSGIGCGKNLTSNGLSVFRLAEKKALTINKKKYTLLEALALEEYGKVYLSLGVNELGYRNDEGFYTSYCAAIDEIRKLQPGAVIYIQGLIPLNEGQVMASSGKEYLTNEHLRIYNELMRQAAKEKQVVFLDLYSEFVDENGELPEGASRDGVHLVKEACQQWLEYLKTHTVDFETLYPEGVPAVEGESPEGTVEDGSEQG